MNAEIGVHVHKRKIHNFVGLTFLFLLHCLLIVDFDPIQSNYKWSAKEIIRNFKVLVFLYIFYFRFRINWDQLPIEPAEYLNLSTI